MKKVIYVIICICIIITLFFGVLVIHGSRVVNRVGDNMYANFVNNCEPGSVRIRRSFLGVSVEGWDCDGPESGGQ